MLAKKYRFPIQFFPRTGLRTLRTRYFMVKIAHSSLSRSRFGILVSKKIEPRATRRNMLRRRIFDFIRLHVLPHERKAREVLLIPSPSVEALSKEDLAEALREAFAGL